VASPHAAQLVDAWGRGHGVGEITRLGRELGQVDLGILDESVSRQHAELRLDGTTGAWHIADLGSTNGTFVDGRRLDAPVGLVGHELVVVGHVGFVFLVGEAAASHARLRLRVGHTGGIVEHANRSAWLAADELAFLGLLVARRGERDGYVTSTEVLELLRERRESAAATDVAPLARRTRAMLASAGLGDLLERCARAGYRVRPPAHQCEVDLLSDADLHAAAALASSRLVTLGSRR
jgi:hypothetical protein